MTLLNLSFVTRAFTEYLARQIELSPVWQPRPRPTVASTPPDQMPGAGLSFYLYHVVEPEHYRNAMPPDPASDHLRHTPMTLDLHYQMSATPAGTSEAEMQQSQLLFGLALKALRDAVVLNDDTTVNGVNIFQLLGLHGAENRFRPVLQPLAPTEAVSYWTAGTTALRLAAYYTVSVVQLEPEALTQRAGRVFDYSVTALIMGAPFITSTETEIAFDMPNGTPQSITVSPASVPYGDVFFLTGANFVGDRVELLLRGGSDPAPRLADAPWAVMAQPTRITARAAETAEGLPVLPGAYAAQVRTIKIVNGREISALSNPSPVQIAPSVTQLTSLGGGAFRVDGAIFEDPGIAAEDVEVRIGAEMLTRSGAAPAAGEFQVVSRNRIDLVLPAGLVAGADLPLRIHVRGAETPPRWVRVP
ncbi:MAG: Pvc16 family protein [Sulfitobacter sp.]|uniref:Pvc16 family protein n=1 Tax=Sulfitobacter sp. TaxID=1903071 RepID=UPI0032982AE5